MLNETEFEAQVFKLKKYFDAAPKKAEKLLKRAYVKAAKTLRASMVRYTRDDYTIRADVLRKSMRVYTKEGKAKWTSGVQVKGRAVKVEYFRKSYSESSGLKVYIKKVGSGRHENNAFKWKGMFLKRQRSDRYPLTPLYGPSAPQMVENEGAAQKALDESMLNIEKNIEYQFSREWWR